MTVSAGWLWEMRSAIVARVRDRNRMEVADDLGHRFWRFRMADRSGVINGRTASFIQPAIQTRSRQENSNSQKPL